MVISLSDNVNVLGGNILKVASLELIGLHRKAGLAIFALYLKLSKLESLGVISKLFVSEFL